MLTAEAAQKQLEKWQVPQQDDIDPDDVVTRYCERFAALPTKLSDIGFGLHQLTEKGKKYPEKESDKAEQRLSAAIVAFDRLSGKDRTQLLQVVFPKLAVEVNLAWEMQRSTPYAYGWSRSAFRAPNNPAASLPRRWSWLNDLLNIAGKYYEDQITAAWLAAWAPFIRITYSGYEEEIGILLAATIDRGGKSGEDVFEIVCQSARNEHDIGGMGRHVLEALLRASRVEGWELIEKLLLAAQRQEGLRQSILESLDHAHPDAMRRLLRIILEHDLVRFSSVVRAVDVWFGFAWGSASPKVVNRVIEQALSMLEDLPARKRALQGDDPQLAYLALWATAVEDAESAIEPATKLLDHAKVEMRFVSSTLLGKLELDAARTAMDRCLEDPDLRVAFQPFAFPRYDQFEVESPFKKREPTTKDLKHRFNRLAQLFERTPEKPQKLPAIVWPWTEKEIGRSQLGPELIAALAERPLTDLVPYLKSFGAWERTHVISQLSDQQKWDESSRSILIDLAGDSTVDVRKAALLALQKIKLAPAELPRLEALLSRKASDLRRGILEVILNNSDDAALASSDRLLAAKDVAQRQAGLELIRLLFEQKRCVAACRERLEKYRALRTKLSKEEQTQISAVLDVAADAQVLTLENALGLMDPAKRSPVVAPKAHKVQVFSDAAVRCLTSLDGMIHKHREQPIPCDWKPGTQELLGTIGWGFPSCRDWKSIEKEALRLPLREVWEEWWKKRPKNERDADGLELWRAGHFFSLTDSWDFDDIKKWAARKERKAIADLLDLKRKPVKLKYERVVLELLEWLRFLHPATDRVKAVMEVCETLCALVPASDLKSLIPKKKDAKQAANSDDDDDESDWRDFELFGEWLNEIRSLGVKSPDVEFARIWTLLHWLDQPIAGASRHRPGWAFLRRAYSMSLARFDDLADELAGPRSAHDRFELLDTLTARKLDAEDEQFLQRHPEVRELVRRCCAIVLDTELKRGDSPTVVSQAVNSICSLEGIDSLVRILTALGKTNFKKKSYYYSDTNSREESLTRLASVTGPSKDETHAQFASTMRAAVRSGAFPEDRLLELAFLAPQWVKFVEAYLEWDGFAEALYWFLAHMNSWGSNASELAAEGAGLEADDDDQDADDDVDEDTDDADGESKSVQMPAKLSAWQRLILERTSLTEQERQDGAIDVAWFRRVHSELGQDRWKQLAKAARFAANASQAKKAQLLADILLGEAKIDDLITGIKKKYLKEYVRLIGLFPLPTGTKRAAELKRRFEVLQEYGRYARQLSGLTKPEALRSLQIGLRNLAGTAGYPDPIRLEWELGAADVKDLGRGSVSASKDGVTVTLALDEDAKPQVSVMRGDKLLKSAPPAVKKDKQVAALFERAKDLKRQSSRQKQSLEAMMCRGETISSSELVALCEHALVAPLIERLVFLGDGIAGYPDKKGKVLRDFAGKLEPLGKSEQLRIAHPFDLFQLKSWDKWQHECMVAERVQPLKQIFRELYIVTKQEKSDKGESQRYAGQQVQPRQALALWGQRGWNTDEGVFKTFHDEDIIASVSFDHGYTTPAEVEGLTIDSVSFSKRNEYKSLPLTKVPPRLFSEVMRDLDLVVSVAHAGGVDPEATASTVEMRTNLLRETCQLLSLKNVRFKANQAVIDGQLANYTVHLGSGTVHRMPGGSVCIVPVHSQHRGRLFLPFADDDPRTAEVMSKVLMLARDNEIQDPSILSQLRA